MTLESLKRLDVIGDLEVEVVRILGDAVGGIDEEAACALALAVRGPLRGHVCVDLLALRSETLCEAEEVALPKDRAAWIERVAACPLVGGPRDARPFVLRGGRLYSQRYYRYEDQLAAQLNARFAAPPNPAPAQLPAWMSALFAATGGVDRQRLGATMAVLRDFAVISGGPGTGKTYTVRSVLALLWLAAESDQRSLAVALSAPTGKAAARMKQSLLAGLEPFLDGLEQRLERNVEPLRSLLTDLQPVTLHRLLGYQPATPSRFRHHHDHPLPFDVVVVDEASMVDLAMMAKLVDAVAPTTKLILLGDQHQLASVEAGTVLADLCGPTRDGRIRVSEDFGVELQAAGLTLSDAVSEPQRGPYDSIVQLDKSRRFRSDSGIGRFAQACLRPDFEPRQAASLLTSDAFADVRLLPPRGSLLSLEAEALVLEGYRPYLERLVAGPGPGEAVQAHHRGVLEDFERFRVLAAHRAGSLGVEGLNQRVVELLVEYQQRQLAVDASSPWGRFAFESSFWLGMPVLVVANDYMSGRFNGDVGVVVRHQGRLMVAFSGEGDQVEYLAPARLPPHQLTFAMTIHKSQGSEFAHAMVVLPARASAILTRELVYTGVTRARTQMTLVGTVGVLEQALQRTVQRASGLSASLWEMT